MSSLKQRKKKKKKTKSIKPSKNKKNASSTKKKKKSNQLPLMFRLMIAGMFLMAIYKFKCFYFPTSINSNNVNNESSNQNETNKTIDTSENDLTTIINANDLDLSATKLKDISPRFGRKKRKNIPALRIYTINDFWTESMAFNLSNQLYNEFMDESLRDKHFLFTVNKGNEKIRGNDNIESKTENAIKMLKNNRFSYCKYEYKRSLPLYKSILGYLNSSFAINMMSKLFKVPILGVSDLFISVYYKDNFLTTHDDRGLGHYAFINFLSQNWDFNNGGSLHFNCQTKEKWRESCYEIKMKFNQNVNFKVWPESVPHFVSTVTIDQPRIAITGWYFTDDPRGIMWHSIAEETGYGEK